MAELQTAIAAGDWPELAARGRELFAARGHGAQSGAAIGPGRGKSA